MIESRYTVFMEGLINKEKHKLYLDKKNRIGRKLSESDIYIDDQLISRRHAEMSFEENQLFMIDLDSKNGTYINNTRAIAFKKYKIKDNDLIGFAQHQYRVYIKDQRCLMNTKIKIKRIEMNGREKICIDIKNPNLFLAYQFQLLIENKNRHLIELERVSESASEILYYDVTGMNSLDNMISNRKLSIDDFKGIVLKIVKVVQDTEKLLLNKESFLLTMDTVFFLPDTEEIRIIYVPIKNNDLSYVTQFKSFLGKLIKDYVECDPLFRGEIFNMISMDSSNVADIVEKIVWYNPKIEKVDNGKETSLKMPWGKAIESLKVIGKDFMKRHSQ